MNYRLYKAQDFATLYSIEEICFAPPLRFGKRYIRELVEARNGATWIAEDAGAMAGFAIVEWSKINDGLQAYIPTIEVLPAWRGRGAGRGLLECLERSARDAGAAKIWLHVDVENAGAIGLYEGSGFVRAGEKENFYPNGHGAFVYGKEIGGVNDSDE